MTYDDLLIISPGTHCSQYGYNYVFVGERFVEECGKFYSIYSFQKVSVGFKFEIYDKYIEIKFEIYNKQIGLDMRTKHNKSQLETLEMIDICSIVKVSKVKDRFKTSFRYANYMKQFQGESK